MHVHCHAIFNINILNYVFGNFGRCLTIVITTWVKLPNVYLPNVAVLNCPFTCKMHIYSSLTLQLKRDVAKYLSHMILLYMKQVRSTKIPVFIVSFVLKSYAANFPTLPNAYHEIGVAFDKNHVYFFWKVLGVYVMVQNWPHRKIVRSETGHISLSINTIEFNVTLLKAATQKWYLRVFPRSRRIIVFWLIVTRRRSTVKQAIK